MILGLDLGFRQNKSVSLSGTFIFPSLIGNPSAFELDQLRPSQNATDDLVIKANGATYYVGSKALETDNARLCTEADKTNSDNDKMAFLAALGLHVNANRCEDYIVVTGLPVEDLKNPGLKEQIIKNLKGTHDFYFGKKEAHVRARVHDVLVIPQSAGAYFDYILDNNGSPVRERLSSIKGHVIVIDVGYKTTDIITMVNGSFVSKMSCTIEKGMRDIHKELARLIFMKFGRKFNLSELDDVCRKRSFHDKGRVEDISNLILTAEKPIAEVIINETNALLGDTRKADKVLGCGGTMNILSPYFEPFYKGYFEVLPDAEFGNASGYYKFGKMNASNFTVK